MLRRFERCSAGSMLRRAGTCLPPGGPEPLVEALESRQMLAVDLLITAINLPTTQFRPGDVVSTTAGYRNAGSTASPVFTVRFVASVDNVYGNADDVVLYADSSDAGLAPGTTVTSDPTPVTVPSLPVGNYFVIGKVDSGDVIGESNETNNVFVRAGQITILPPPSPDYVISSVAITGTSFVQGQSVSAGVTYANSGDAAYFGPLGARFVASINNVYGDLDDVEIFSGALGGGSVAMNAHTSALESLAFQIPVNLAARSYLILGFIDTNANVSESSESNNVFVRAGTITVTAPPLPDLQLASITTPAPVTVGGSVNVTAVVRNTGNLAAGAFTVRYYLSEDNQLQGFDTLLAERNVAGLAPGAMLSDVAPLSVPGGALPGAYFLIAQVDGGETVVERDENNNLVRTATPALIVNGPANAADLTVTSVTTGPTAISVGFDGTVMLSASVTLRSQFASSGLFSSGVYLSRDRIAGNADDILVAFLSSTLGAGESETRQVTGALPAGTAPGAYNVLARADFTNSSAERDEGNNAAFGSTVMVPTPADLTISFTPTAGTVARGGFITGTLTLRNSGQAPAGAFEFTIGLSSDAVFDAGDPELLFGRQTTGIDVRQVGLAGGQTLTISNFKLPVPTAFTPGSYRVVARIDSNESEPDGDVPESNENNNTFIGTSANVTISNVSPNANPVLPDFTASVSPLSGTYAPGQVIKGNIVLTNLGAQGPTPPVFRAYLSTNSTLDAGDLPIDQDVLAGDSGPIDPGSAYFGGALSVPVNALSGQYYLIVELSGPQDESNLGNNVVVSASPVITVARPLVSVTASDAAAAETATGATDPGRITFTRTGPTSLSLTVNIDVGGTATDGVDYTASALEGGDIIYFAPGQSSVVMQLNVTPDGLAEGTETATVRVRRGQGYTLDVTRREATVNIADNKPVVSVRAGSSAAEGSTSAGGFTVARTGPTTSSMDVLVRLSGTAGLPNIAGAVDVGFSAAGGALTGPFLDGSDAFVIVTIPAGQASRTVSFTAVDDLLAEGVETVIATVVPSGQGYVVSTAAGAASATVNVNDNEGTVGVTGGAAVSEGAATQGVFTFTRTGPTTGAVDVEFAISGTASLLSNDFELVSGDLLVPPSQLQDGRIVATVHFNAGQSSRTVRFRVIDDLLAEQPETVRVDLDPRNDPHVGVTSGRGTASVTINDNEPVVSVTLTGTPAEGSAAPFSVTFARTGPTTQGQSVVFSLFGVAGLGSDFTFSEDPSVVGANSYLFVIPAGQASKTVPINVINEFTAEGPESLEVRLAAINSYLISPTRGSASTVIADNEAAVSVVAGSSASEASVGTSGRLTFSRTGQFTNLGLVVEFHVTDVRATLGTDYAFVAATGLDQVPSAANGFTGRIIFAANQTAFNLEYRAINDAAVEGPEDFRVDVNPSPTYSIVAGRTSATGLVNDDEAFTLVSVRAADAAGAETAQTATPNVVTFTLTRSRSGAAQTVNFDLTGDAVEGVDYLAIPHSVTFGASETSRTITITPLADGADEALESVGIHLLPGAGFFVNPVQQDASGTIASVANAVVRTDVNQPIQHNIISSLSILEQGPLFNATLAVFNSGSLRSGALLGSLRLSLDGILGNADDIVLKTTTLAGIDGHGFAVLEFLGDLEAVNLVPGLYRLGILVQSGTTAVASSITPGVAIQLTR